MTNIVFLDRDTLPSHIMVNRPTFRHNWREHTNTTSDQVVTHCQNADIIISNKVPIGESVLSQCSSIKHIAVAATGVNNIDLAACKKHRVSVSNIRNYANTSVPEHTITLALALRRSLLQYRQQVIHGAWQHSPHFFLFNDKINDLANSTFGIIGFGKLGQATAKLAHALGMHVIFYSPSAKDSAFAKQVDFDTLLQQSDIISCHCPLNDQTHHLIGQPQFDAMQPHCIVINTARGDIIDELALVDAIKQQKIGGVGVDVLAEEPPKPNATLLSIADRTNVIITPHIAWASTAAMQTLANQLIANINAFHDNQPQNLVTPSH